MKNSYFGNLIASLFFTFFSLSASAVRAQDAVVIIEGSIPTCTGDCQSAGLISASAALDYGISGWGLAVAANTASGHDDGTRGNSDTFNRQPGCLKEGLFMDEIAGSALNGDPQGTVIFDNPTVPPYNAAGWKKYGVVRISHQWSQQTNMITRWRWNVHYMYNIYTHEVSQLKMKNSYETGCIGQKKPAS
jgi:hypothetical protein